MMYSFINCTYCQILLELLRRGRKLNGLLIEKDCDVKHVSMQLHETCVHAVTSLIIVNNQLRS